MAQSGRQIRPSYRKEVPQYTPWLRPRGWGKIYTYRPQVGLPQPYAHLPGKATAIGQVPQVSLQLSYLLLGAPFFRLPSDIHPQFLLLIELPDFSSGPAYETYLLRALAISFLIPTPLRLTSNNDCESSHNGYLSLPQTVLLLQQSQANMKRVPSSAKGFRGQPGCAPHGFHNPSHAVHVGHVHPEIA